MILVIGGGSRTGRELIRMLGAGLQRWMADALVELYRDYRRSGQDGYAARLHDGVRAVTGQEPRTLAQALADP